VSGKRDGREIASSKRAALARWAAALGVVLAAGCSKASPQAGGAGAPGASAATAGGSAAPSAALGASSALAAFAFAGSYVAKVGPVEPPSAAKEKAWAEDPGTASVGKGNMQLSVERPAGSPNDLPGKVSGEATGALGDMGIAGTFDGRELRANLTPKQPNVPGAMTGYMTLTADGAALKGTLRVSNANARVVREASVELARK
jgi:hypothetical protein